MRVDVAGRGLDFLLDTGASGIVIDQDVVEQLGLEQHGSYSNSVNAGRIAETSAIVPEMKIGSLTMRDVAVVTEPHVGLDRPALYKIVGLLGFDFIDAVGLKFDYAAGTVTAQTTESFEAPTDPETIDLDVRLASMSPQTSITVNGALGERFVLDTGASGSLMFFDYLQRRHPEALSDREQSDTDRNMRFVGVGGDFGVRPYRVRSVVIGNVTFTDFVALAVTSPTSYSGNEDGLIGSDILRLFTVYADYAAGKMYLTPNELGRGAISK